MNQEKMDFWKRRTWKFHKPELRINEELQEGYTEIILLENDKVIVGDLLIKAGDRLELLWQDGGYILRVSKSDKVICYMNVGDVEVEIVKTASGRQIIIKEE